MRRELFTRVVTIAASAAAVAAVVIPGTAITETVSPPGKAAAAGPERAPTTYVALGSSYAAGPDLSSGVRPPCFRTDDNYPHQVATARGMRLIDASCSGATTPDIVDRAQRPMARRPQVAAIPPGADLVTITTGGNDLDYVGRVTALSCRHKLRSAGDAITDRVCSGGRTVAPEPTPAAYQRVERRIIRAVEAVRARAPHARIVLVDYLPIVGTSSTTCAALPLSPSEIAQTRRVFDGLTDATSRAAQATGAQLVTASKSGAAHGVCSSQPWVYGFEGGAVYHPTPAGKTAVAQLVLRALR
ncbi:SGNH/GDSL hydrolase family protein [Gordonia insulae]|uniref:Lipase 2 n=1 Tax=Gordonia insulae TaxID=2420509 RepID=A0A3G8JNK3_9ACTN|nr:SGNH/GDSL hydrolase family protein [Gordonia insulae]AZG46039.1 Lipase 2 [Gordonia insulae]